MKTDSINENDWRQTGVYCIKSLISGKSYIGSTSMYFQKRFFHHQSLLRANKHKNSHLQRSWNKYGEENFEFTILQITPKEDTLACEQFWIDYYKDNNKELFNINPLASGTPSLSEEVIKKRAATMRRKYASGEIISYFKGKETWNKGKTKVTGQDYSYLKGIPKTITEEVLISREKRTERLREEYYPSIYVYDSNYKFLGRWRTAIELQEWSLTNQNDLPIKSRFKGEMRRGKPWNYLGTCNILISCKTGNPYKNLYFSFTETNKYDKEGSGY